ncbi:hypothetical protein [Mucilaginibacter segetis]|uniref:Carboxypeptidase-like protein n=1 Tax=Mucilaginibacter segetis TaxID=2793071 RepID=A0A934PV56_9SPHI|nr:hypothetical protein [Mucilaginibacter segetis]MBK0379980.1 hypothetical protein [Mucilaginibacter segetis]
MKLWLCVFFLISSFSVFGQQKEIDGIVFNKESEARVAKVNILNTNTGKSVYNNFKGEFKIDVSPGDKLIFSSADYKADTIILKNYSPLAVYMQPLVIQLKQVDIFDTKISPQKKLEATKKAYNKIYGSLGDRDLLSVSPGAGVGINIDALYNIFSKSGRNARHLQEVIEADYKQSIIDFRFNKSFVGRVTGLHDPDLSDFMAKYRPGYYFVIAAKDYEFIASIQNNLKRYLRNPDAYNLPVIVPTTTIP